MGTYWVRAGNYGCRTAYRTLQSILPEQQDFANECLFHHEPCFCFIYGCRDFYDRQTAQANKKNGRTQVESEKRFQLLFNNSGDEIFLADFDGNFIEVNQEALRRLGYTREELMNKNFSDIKTEKYIPLVKKNIEKILKHGQHIYETEHIAKDGTVIFLEMSSRVIDYFGAKAILSIARDITERKEIERRIATAIIETEERKRKRFAADLHNDL